MTTKMASVTTVGILLFGLSVAPAIAGQKETGDIGREVRALAEDVQQLDHPDTAENALRLSNRLNDAFRGIDARTLSRLTDADVRELFDLVNEVAFITVLKDDVKKMETVYAELRKRGLNSVTDDRHMFNAYLQLREFDDAAHFEEAYEGDLGQSIPTLSGDAVVPGQPAYMHVGIDDLRVEAVDLENGARVVVIAHPFCAFSRRAMDVIENDVQLRELFKDSIWLAPQDRRLELDAIRAWNTAAERTRLKLMFDQWKWPLPDARQTPLFYFLKDGKVEAVVTGWPKEGRRDELVAAFRKIE